MKLHHIILGIVLVSLIIMGSLDYLADMSSRYNVDYNIGNLSRTEERLKEQEQLQGDLTDIFDATIDEGTVLGFTAPYKLMRAAWTSIKIFKNQVEILGAMINDTTQMLSSYLGLPSWITTVFYYILIVLFVAMIIYAIFKWIFTT